ncbi:MAG: hypothetical protein WA885_02285 [Phormidesmis sp.]
MKTISIRWLLALSGLGVLLAVGPAQAISFTESGDAGESLTDAISVTADQPTPLDSISGVLSGDADLFKIFLTGGQTFSATTLSSTTAEIPVNQAIGIPIEVVIDPKIFLFDALGNGVYANDDAFGSTQSTLLSGPSGFSPPEPGNYFLGISGSGYEAFSANGQIFPTEPFDQQAGPTGPGGGAPLTEFAGDRTLSFGKYTLSLTGAQTVATANSPVSVPDPSMTLSLLALGAVAVTSKIKKLGDTQNETLK